MTTPRIAPLAAALLLAAGCGGGSSDPATGFAVKGTVSGLAGSNLVLHLGPATPGQDLAVAADGPFAFPGALADGSAYAVSVKTQPAGPTQACVVSGGSGTIAGADASVTVTCTTSSFPVGGTVTGLAGGTLLLRNGGGDDLEVVADGPFAFAAPVASGATFSVTVAQQPIGQTCAVAGGAGTVVAGPVTSVVVTCEATDKPVAGTISGLAGATGVVLQVNGAHDTTLTTNGPFEVPTGLPGGTAWTLTVKTQPTQPWQTCLVTGGSGTMGPSGAGGVAVTCATDAFAVGGTVSGLLQAGLSVRLSVGGAPVETIEPAGDGSLAFTQTALSGQAYLVEVVASPPTQVCSVTGAGGVVAGAPVGDVAVGCACAPGLASCSQLVQDGCEVQTLVDPLHCGGCGRACSALLPNTSASTCAAGQCEVAVCSTGYDDCGPGAGCETPVAADPANCGACGHVCTPPPNATAGCASSTCGLGACTAGFGDCNGVAADGCETSLLATTDRCGACVAPNCAGGTCDAGFGNCDGLAVNGCEATLATDPLHCGACGNSCDVYPNAAGVCTAGAACSMGACDAGWDDCNGLAADGCETQVDHDPANCGACGTVCDGTNGTAACLDNSCTMSACNAGWGNCRGDAFPGCETNTTNDPLHCGSCGFACAAGQICGGSACVAPPSCKAILALAPSSLDGVYTVDPDGVGGSAAVDVWCDMTTDGGGWTFFAHVNGDYQAGRLFELDLGAYDPSRGDTNASYGLGGKVYQRIGATELMVTLDVVDTLTARNADRFVVYQFAPNAPAFDAGPVPSLAPGALFKYRTHFDPLADGIINPDFFEDVWAPYTAEPDPFVGGFMGVAPLTLLNGTGTVGTFWGSGMAPPGTPGVDTSGHDSWWYAR